MQTENTVIGNLSEQWCICNGVLKAKPFHNKIFAALALELGFVFGGSEHLCMH